MPSSLECVHSSLVAKLQNGSKKYVIKKRYDNMRERTAETFFFFSFSQSTEYHISPKIFLKYSAVNTCLHIDHIL